MWNIGTCVLTCLTKDSDRTEVANQMMSPVHFHTGVHTYKHDLNAKMQSYGRYLIPSGLNIPNVSFTFTPFLRSSLICNQRLFYSIGLVHSGVYMMCPDNQIASSKQPENYLENEIK